ncbi:hypothetical protein [Butyrivibrio sp. AE2032]|uniref:hypothetical protein n=1 Tax=Butyrivibrio sp. AE2032 TaxID=1458463 RepID=UPI0005511427|nr:hypothetical protein [Butyrivibrio sp. AE2032]
MSTYNIERFLSNIGNLAIWAAPAVLFIVFLVLFIVNLRKFKKERAKPFKVKAIVFGCLSGYFLLTVAGEICLVLFLAAAVAHM